MSATDELRELLDERGVEYKTDDRSTSDMVTWFDLDDGREVSLDEFDGGTTLLKVWGETPKQAIAATLGNDGAERSNDGVAERERDQLKDENAKLRDEFRKMDEWHSRELLAAVDENDKLRELLRDTLIQTYQYCDKYGIEYEDGTDAWEKADADIDRRLRELGVVE